MLMRHLAIVGCLGAALTVGPPAHAAPPAVVDSDHDGLSDDDEVNLVGTNPQKPDTDDDGFWDGVDDQDGDGLTNAAEIAAGTDPQSADTDDDELNDFRELKAYHTNPLVADSDGDGLADADEVLAFGSDPNDADSDSDGLPDGQEVNFYGTSPTVVDSDGDGVGDGDEALVLRTDPLKVDSDDNQKSDGDEDADGDGLTNHQETMITHTDPIVRDSDHNNTEDGAEDADQDGLGTADELKAHTDPGARDTDHDGVMDGEEVHHFLTNPLVGDSDGDGLSDLEETTQGDVDPNDADSDDDGVLDGDELRWDEDSDGDQLVNAMDPDADGDGVLDGTEMGVATAGADTTVGLGYFVADADLGRTTSNMVKADSDGAGVPDGVEDANHNGRVDADERDPVDPLDDGAGAMIVVTALPEGDTSCAQGGRKVEVGFDNGEGNGTPADGVLDADEVDASTIICDGVDGLVSLTVSGKLAIGDPNCELGGTRVDTGIDDSRDGTLGADEVDSTAFICSPKAEVGGWGGGGCDAGQGAESGLWGALAGIAGVGAWARRRARGDRSDRATRARG